MYSVRDCDRNPGRGVLESTWLVHCTVLPYWLPLTAVYSYCLPQRPLTCFSRRPPDGSAEHALYNSCYMTALKETPSYVQWADGQHLGVLEVNPGHPCSGQLSMADMRLRISQ